MTEKNKELLAIILICLTAFSVYLNILPNSFIFDDWHMIVKNNYIKNPHYLSYLFKDSITSYPIAKGMYRPILMLSFAFNYLTSGLRPHSYHIINILIHFLNAVFLFRLLKILLKDLTFALSLGITLIFCLHPINTEAVTYISSRSDLLCSFFILSGLYAYISSEECKKKSLYLLSLILYPLALLTKESGLVFLGLVVAYEFVYEVSENPSKTTSEASVRILPFILITLGYFILIKVIFGNVFGLFGKVRPSFFVTRPLSANILTQAAVSFFYLYLFFFPFRLCIDHNFPIINSFTNSLGLIPLVLILALIFVCLFFKKHIKPVIGFSCLWYFISLLPKFYARLNLVCAEHQAYLAYFSLYFILGFLFTKLRIKKIYPVRNSAFLPKSFGISNGVYFRQLFFFILGLFFLLSLIRNFQWRNEYTLWQATLKVNPNSAIAQGGLGGYLVNKGFFQEGIEYFKKSASSKRIGRDPQVTSLLNLAHTYATLGKPDEARKILSQNPELLFKADPFIYLNVLGYIHLKEGKFTKARDIWEEALSRVPEYAELQSDLGWLYLENLKGKQRAKEYFKKALSNDPALALAHLGLARILEEEDLNQAIGEYKKTISLAPENFQAYYNLGLIYAQKMLSQEAEWYFKKVIELNPDFAPAYYNLCVFYLSLPQPDYKLALEYFNKAKSLGYNVDKEIEEILRKKEIPIK